MNIIIATCSGVTDKNILKLIESYTPRYGRYAKLEMKDIKYSEKNLNDFTLKYKNYYKFFLDEEGKSYSSVEFSKKIEKIKTHQNSNILFVIGPSAGFSKSDLSLADELLSLSPLTFPHEITTLLLTEQIYRAITISNNHPYHKE